MILSHRLSSIVIAIISTSTSYFSLGSLVASSVDGAKPSSSFFVFPSHGNDKRKEGRSGRHATAKTTTQGTTQISGIVGNNHVEDIPILFENSSLLAINKPHGVPYHDDPVSETSGIVTLLRAQRLRQDQYHHLHSSPSISTPHLQLLQQKEERLYGVHRLDRVTSGILLFAKSPRVASVLMNKFANNNNNRNKDHKDLDDGIVKFYFGISGKKPKKKQGWVNGHMVKGRRGSYKLLPTANNDDKNNYNSNSFNDDTDSDEDVERGGATPARNSSYASTRFYTAGLGHLPLSSPQSPSHHDDNGSNEERSEQHVRFIPKTAILFRPHTGKTHQLRVAAKSLGLPLLGDARYGGGRVGVGNTDIMVASSSSSSEDDIVSFDRTYLHASAIHFTLDSESVTIWSPPPFAHLVSSSDNIGNGEKNLLDDVFERMMGKHCDCQPIIDAMYAK